MQESTYKPEARQAGRKKSRLKHQVDGSGQLVLFAGLANQEEATESQRGGPGESRRYLDPSPEGIVIGGESLREYLTSRNLGRVFRIRELLRGLALEGFYQGKSKAGRRPYHPASMLGVILYGVLEGKHSLRGLEELARRDLQCMWLSGGIQPDHSSIGRFIQEHGEVLQGDFFEELTRQVLQQTQSGSGDVSGDGTVIQAAASAYRRIRLEAAQQKVQQLEALREAEPEDVQLQARAEAAQQVVQILKQRQQRRQAEGRKGAVQVSVTEPEAVHQPLKATGGYATGYRPTVLANELQIIVAQTVDPSHERATYESLLDQAERTGEKVHTVRWDGEFFHPGVIEQSQRRGVNLLSPEESEYGKRSRRRTRKTRFHKREFVYDPTNDCYVCPAGQRLVPRGQGHSLGRLYQRYGGAPCGRCRLRRQCTRSRAGRTVKRYHNESLIEQQRAKMSDPRARQEYRKRLWMVEPVFSRVKHRQQLQRFRRRGLDRVRVEFALHAAAYNLSRLLSLIPTPGLFFDLFFNTMGSLKRPLLANEKTFKPKHARLELYPWPTFFSGECLNRSHECI